MDQSAMEAINMVAEKYLRVGESIHLWHLSADGVRHVERAEKICVVNVLADPGSGC